MKRIISDPQKLDQILNVALVGSLAVVDEEGFPYIIPVNYVYYRGNIYIHGAKKGTKIDCITHNDRIGFQVHNLKKINVGRDACHSGAKYESVVIKGHAGMIEEHNLKKEILQEFAVKYTPEFAGQELPNASVERTDIIELRPLSVSGKENY